MASPSSQHGRKHTWVVACTEHTSSPSGCLGSMLESSCAWMRQGSNCDGFSEISLRQFSIACSCNILPMESYVASQQKGEKEEKERENRKWVLCIWFLSDFLGEGKPESPGKLTCTFPNVHSFKTVTRSKNVNDAYKSHHICHLISYILSLD